MTLFVLSNPPLFEIIVLRSSVPWLEYQTYGLILGLWSALLPSQDLVSFRNVEVRKVQPLLATDVLDEISLGADRFITVSKLLIF